MSIINVPISETIGDWRTEFNALATFVGDTTGLNSSITDNTSPDDLVQAINYVFSIAGNEDTDFTNAVTFQSNITVNGTSEFQGTVTCNGSFTFNDTGSAAVTIIHDDDNMSADDATGLATQQSIKAYVDALSGTVDADTVDGVQAASFLRSDADDTVNNDIHIQFGDGSSGSVRLEHNSTTNLFAITPHDGTSFNTSHNLEFDGDNDYWNFAGEMRVAGAFTSRGIDDNATSNVFQLENASITLKQPTTVTGALTISSGNVLLSDAENILITNSAGEYIEFDGSTVNGLNLYAGGLLGVGVSATEVTLAYAGSEKLATVTGGISVTGDVTFTGTSLDGPSTFDITNQAGEEIRFTGSSMDLYVGASNIIGLTASAVALNQNTTVTGDLDVSGNVTMTSGTSLTLPNAGVIDNGSGESITFSTTAISMAIGSSAVFAIDSAGADVTGDLDVTGTITGTLGNVTLGNITTGTISSGAITASGSLTITSGDIILPSSTTAADVGNNAGEYVRFDGTNNETEIVAGSDIGVLCTATETQLRYNSSEKLATTSGGIAVTGAITATGDITAFSSDAKLKILQPHVMDYDALNIINQLRGVAYNWNELSLEVNPASDLEGLKFGFLAQEVERVLPEMLGPETKGYKTLRYEAVIPILVNAINELTERLKKLEDK